MNQNLNRFCGLHHCIRKLADPRGDMSVTEGCSRHTALRLCADLAYSDMPDSSSINRVVEALERITLEEQAAEALNRFTACLTALSYTVCAGEATANEIWEVAVSKAYEVGVTISRLQELISAAIEQGRACTPYAMVVDYLGQIDGPTPHTANMLLAALDLLQDEGDSSTTCRLVAEDIWCLRAVALRLIDAMV